jgi:hypothetical protein
MIGTMLSAGHLPFSAALALIGCALWPTVAVPLALGAGRANLWRASGPTGSWHANPGAIDRRLHLPRSNIARLAAKLPLVGAFAR